MRQVTGLMSAVIAAAGMSLAAQSPTTPGHEKMSTTPVAEATANIAGEGITGTATFKEMKHGDSNVLMVQLTASGLKPGLHGIHLHAVGKCEAPFTSAGGHFDPGPAGNPDPDANHPYHFGDLPNLKVGADGKGELSAVTTRALLTDGPNTLLDPDGSAIIIHGNPDQGITGESKSGVSGGPRVACGVIQKK
jgi:superoxide dismutase, Cu-Zn family